MRLSRTTSFLIIVVVISLLVGGLIGFYFYEKNKNKPAPFPSVGNSGKSIGYSPEVNKPGTTTFSDTIEQPAVRVVPKLRHITVQPIAGSGYVFETIIATTSTNIEPPDLSLVNITKRKVVAPKVISIIERIRWMERATGHVYQTSTSTLDVTRLSNTTLTRIYESLFSKNSSLVMRDLVGTTDIIRSRYATLNLETPTSTEQSLIMSDLPVNIIQMALSPDGNQMFSIMNTGVRGILSNTDGSSKVGIFDSPFKEWLVQWPNKTNIILTTKPSGSTAGYAYALNPQTKSFSRIMGGVNGLVTLASPDASKILFSDGTAGSFNLSVFDRKTSTINPLFVRTIADKCVWSTTEVNIVYCGVPTDVAFNFYPDAWYQGQIVFSDSIWSINVTTNETQRIVYPPDEVGSIIDVTNASISSGGDYMIFQNKIDLSLWGLQVKEPQPQSFLLFGNTASTTASSTR